MRTCRPRKPVARTRRQRTMQAMFCNTRGISQSRIRTPKVSNGTFSQDGDRRGGLPRFKAMMPHSPTDYLAGWRGHGNSCAEPALRSRDAGAPRPELRQKACAFRFGTGRIGPAEQRHHGADAYRHIKRSIHALAPRLPVRRGGTTPGPSTALTVSGRIWQRRTSATGVAATLGDAEASKAHDILNY